MKPYQAIFLLITIIMSAIGEAVVFYNSFGKFGLWFSDKGYVLKYKLAEWLNKYLPLWLSKFIAYNILVIFTDLFHLSKAIMIYTFIYLTFGFTWLTFVLFVIWGALFSLYLNYFKDEI